MLDWMAWTWQTALFFGFVAFMLIVLTLLAVYRPETPRDRNSAVSDNSWRSVLRHDDRFGLHFHLLDALWRRLSLVSALRGRALRDRDVHLRVSR